uniref:Transferrin receptor protein 2-like n=1 Tax=Sinocyclocheilus anshuiensis TaxID=1608454 RepID=A0A671PAV9_9TELE
MMDSVTGLISGQAVGGGAQANEGVEEGGGVRRRVPPVELKLVPLEEGLEVTLNSDITSALMLQRQMDRGPALPLTLARLMSVWSTAFLLGYVAFRGMCRLCGNDGDLIPLSDAAGAQHSAEGGVMYMAELREMLKKYLKEERIENTLRRVSRASHPPGSSEGNAVAREILQNLQNLRMDHTWTDSHYATLQFPSRTQPNALWLVDSEGAELEEIPLDSKGYCAYSATGTATGGVVYVNYGRSEDFEQLRAMGVALNGSIAVARVGGAVSFAEKVWHAQEAGLVGILIYPDPADVPQDPRRLGLHSNAVISEHVHLGSGDPFTPGFPSFNHTQFPSTQSSGLPIIPAQPISANVASKLLR